MDKVTFFTATERDGSESEFALIEREDGSFVSMPKSVWDELNANTEGTR